MAAVAAESHGDLTPVADGRAVVGVGDGRAADDAACPAPLPAGELAIGEIQKPPAPPKRLSRGRRPCPDRPAARCALADGQPFIAAKPAAAADPRRPALPAQRHDAPRFAAGVPFFPQGLLRGCPVARPLGPQPLGLGCLVPGGPSRCRHPPPCRWADPSRGWRPSPGAGQPFSQEDAGTLDGMAVPAPPESSKEEMWPRPQSRLKVELP